MKLVFLVSGYGGNLNFFSQCIQRGVLKNFDFAVVADRECPAVHFARTRGLTAVQIMYNRDSSEALRELVRSLQPDVVVTNWNKIIDKDTVREYSGKMIHLHYSLLPAFSGLMGVEPIKQAYSRWCYFTGPTCHFVDADVDTGKIIFQSFFRNGMPIEAVIVKMLREGCISLIISIWRMTRSNIGVHALIDRGAEAGGVNAAVEHIGSEFRKELELL